MAANELAELERLRAEHEHALNAIRLANQDLPERIAAAALDVSYNSDTDVFTLLIGEPSESLTETVGNVIALRVDPGTNKINGIEIIGLREHLREQPGFLTVLLAAMREPKARIELGSNAAGAESSLGTTLKELVLA